MADADPHDTVLQTALVDVLGLAGRGAEAALVLRGLLVKHPDDDALRQKLYDILTWLPLEELEAAHQPPLAELWVEAGDAKREAGDLDGAADFYHKAQISDERCGAAQRLSEVYGQRAADWEQQGRNDLALAALETALRCAPDDGALAARRTAILKGINKQDTTEGIKFEDRFTLSWPPTGPAKAEQPASQDADPFFKNAQRVKIATLEISKIDDMATAYLNGQEILSSKCGLGAKGERIGHQPGSTGVVDIKN